MEVQKNLDNNFFKKFSELTKEEKQEFFKNICRVENKLKKLKNE
jgi:diadenosine tetraphosphate (Ap4A) HIT family hydrolase